jgi:hypothetical protein
VLDRHQARAPRFLLQLTTAIGIRAFLQAVLPGDGKVSRMTHVASMIKDREAEIRRELSSRLELGARQVERPGAETWAQHALHLASEQAA